MLGKKQHKLFKQKRECFTATCLPSMSLDSGSPNTPLNGH